MTPAEKRIAAAWKCVTVTVDGSGGCAWLENPSGLRVLLSRDQAKDAVKKLILWLERTK